LAALKKRRVHQVQTSTAFIPDEGARKGAFAGFSKDYKREDCAGVLPKRRKSEGRGKEPGKFKKEMRFEKGKGTMKPPGMGD